MPVVLGFNGDAQNASAYKFNNSTPPPPDIRSQMSKNDSGKTYRPYDVRLAALTS